MKKKAKPIIIVVVTTLIILLGYLSSIVGWYGYKKWEYRASSLSIQESQKRGVFIRALSYKIYNSETTIPNFTPFIERGFRYGLHSSNQTAPIENSQYPFQLSFNYRPSTEVTILIRNDELKKFDSANTSWGYLKDSYLKDTIYLDMRGPNNHFDTIAVW